MAKSKSQQIKKLHTVQSKLTDLRMQLSAVDGYYEYTLRSAQDAVRGCIERLQNKK